MNTIEQIFDARPTNFEHLHKYSSATVDLRKKSETQFVTFPEMIGERGSSVLPLTHTSTKLLM